MKNIKLKLSILIKKVDIRLLFKFLKRYSKIRPYHKNALSQLKKLNFKHIRKHSFSTWKYYGKNLVRFTYKGTLDSKTYLIKCSKGFEEKAQNSILFQETFNDVFDFIPKGFTLPLEGFYGQAFSFIKSYPFYYFKYFVTKENSGNFTEQICKILDNLNSFKIVHCDINSVNVLIERKSNKLFLIDFDTCISHKVGLLCHDVPRSKYATLTQNTAIYDDAKAFFELLDEINKHLSVFSKEDLESLRSRIGRNVVRLDKKYCNYK